MLSVSQFGVVLVIFFSFWAPSYGGARADDAEPKEEASPYAGSFNRFKLHIEVAQPIFSEDELSGYDDFYGHESLQPSMRIDWYFLNWSYFAFGAMIRGGYYSDRGNASTQSDVYVKDENGELSLTIIPVQLGGALQMTPFSYKWLVLSYWAGVDRTYFQEARARGEASGAGDEAANKIYLNRQWTTQLFTGFSINFLLNPLDEVTARSAKVMGISRIYLSPFFETYKSIGKSSDLKLDRIAYGIGFSFESKGI